MTAKRRTTRTRPSRPVQVTGIRREEIDADELAMVYWLMARRQVRQKRDSEEKMAQEKAAPTDYRSWEDEPIRLVPYDLSWPIKFEEEKARLEQAIGKWVTGDIHHVGSTAVPGLEAKPIIDILVGVKDLPSSRACFEPLAKLSYLYAPYLDTEMHWFCKPHPTHRTHHLHLVPTGSQRYKDELTFRDFLRERPDVAIKYQAAKRMLADSYKHDREGYTNGKTTYIELALKEARGE